MVSRRNIDGLAKQGDHRRKIVTELEDVDTLIDDYLVTTYLEGWTRDELREASSLPQGPLSKRLSNRLRDLGLANDDRCMEDGVNGTADYFGGFLSWIPTVR